MASEPKPMAKYQVPSIGRIVHYVAYGTPGGKYKPDHRAAIITEVDDDVSGVVGLAVLNPSGLFFNQHMIHDEIEKRSGTWHWPEMVTA